MTTTEFLLIGGMALVTFLVRYPILALVSKISLPISVLNALKFIPPAVLTAIIVSAVLLRGDDGINFHYSNAYLIAAASAALVSWWRNNLLLTIVVGLVTLWGWMFLS